MNIEKEYTNRIMDPGTVQDLPVTPLVAPAAGLPFAKIVWFLALLLILFFPVVKPMVAEWGDDPNMGHAFFVPVVAGYIVWKERDYILAAPVKPFWGALVLVFWGSFQMILGFLGADFFVARTALLITGVGLIWTLAGTAVLKRLAFPLFLLLFILRLPLFVYQQITFPLQILASTVAAHALSFIGIPVLRDGNVLELPSQRLAVVEACSGIRSILSLTFLSLAYAYFFDPRKWMRIALFATAIVAAILANSCRIIVTGILSEYKKEWTEGAYHSLEGGVLFMVALVMLVGVHRVICRFTDPAHA
jgi:exosortase